MIQHLTKLKDYLFFIWKWTGQYVFFKYYTAKVKIKDINILIDGKGFFDFSIKNKEESYKKIIEMSKNNDYTTCKLLDYEHFSKHYKLIFRSK